MMTTTPTFRDLINIRLPLGISLSPSGRFAAILARETNWRENRFETVCLIADIAAGKVRRLNTAGTTIGRVEWQADDRLVATRSSRTDTPQIWLYDGLLGEGQMLTDHKGGVELPVLRRRSALLREGP